MKSLLYSSRWVRYYSDNYYCNYSNITTSPSETNNKLLGIHCFIVLQKTSHHKVQDAWCV